MKLSDLKTADGVPFCDIEGDVYEPSETGVRAGHVHRMVLVGWNSREGAKIIATVYLPNGCYIDCQPEAWYADRALAYRKHIELVQNAANKLVAKALEAMNGGAA